MSAPTPATDSKKAPLLSEVEVEGTPSAPPSYEESSTTIAYGDGNVFSDLPRPGAGMGMSYGLPARREPYVPRSERRGWGIGFWSCFQDPGATAKACCCPCVSYGQSRHRLHSPGTPAPVFSTPCLGYCLTASFFPGAESIFGLLQRNEIRQKLGINLPESAGEGNVRLGRAPQQQSRSRAFENVETAIGFLDDAWRHLFCGCCALVQEERETRRWEAEVEEGGALAGLDGYEGEGEGYDPVEEEGVVRAEGERLLGGERGTLRGLRG